MRKNYESPEYEIEKFTIDSGVLTASTTDGWGSGGDEYEDF